jgi:uncharacterized membrane protein YkoI
MKLPRFLGLAAIALLVVGALGMAGTFVFAQTTGQGVPAKLRSAAAAPTQAPEATASGPDTDQVNSQVGDQAGQAGDTTGGVAEQQSPADTGSITVTETSPGALNDTGAVTETTDANEAAALAARAKITVDQAKAAALAANAGATVVKASLDNENGALVYSVELSNGSDVKVDAGNGKILATDTGEAGGASGETGGGAAENDGTDAAGGANTGAGSQVQQP